jgi:hypothetical protein
MLCVSINIIFIFARDNWRHRHNPSEHELVMLDFGRYFLTLLYMTDSHYTFHNFFILYATHILDSGGILCFC